MNDLYIYYQVRVSDAPELQLMVVAMQARLAKLHGVGIQLKRRPEASEDLQTWMEIYTGAGADFPAALDEAVGQAGLSARTAGPRHTEVFTDLLTCA
jgi:hypothetical protein